jgi:hypothetical protein
MYILNLKNYLKIQINKYLTETVKNVPNDLFHPMESDIKENWDLILRAIQKVLDHLEVSEELGGGISLKELAMVETRLNGIKFNNLKGPWAISEEAFEKTKDWEKHPLLKQHCQSLFKNTGIDWQKVEWNQLSQIYYNCIAARLYLFTLSDPLEELFEKRAQYWKNISWNTNTKSPEEYIKRVNSIYIKLYNKSPYLKTKRVSKTLPEDLLDLPKEERSSIKSNWEKINESIDWVLKAFKVKERWGLEKSNDIKKLLQEIAMAETFLGTINNTIRNWAGRGIWQIDPIGFIDTRNVKSHPFLKKELGYLNKAGINWYKVSHNDCNTFLKGAIGAFIFIYLKGALKTDISTAKYRARFWKKWYNTSAGKGSVSGFLEKIKKIKELVS